MKQEDNSEEFFKKFGFTLTIEKRSKKFPDEKIKFTGLEAKHVEELENENSHLLNHIKEMKDRLWWWQEREYRIPFGKINERLKE